MKQVNFITAGNKKVSIQISTPTIDDIAVKPVIILVIEEDGEPDNTLHLSAIAASELSDQLLKQSRKLALLLSNN